MNNRSKVIIGAVVLALLVTLTLLLRQSPESVRPSATPPKAPTSDTITVANSAPAMRIAPPASPPAQLGVQTPVEPPAKAPASSTDPDVAALSAAATDIAKLFRERDFEAIAKKYFPPGVETSFVADNQRLLAEGKVGQYRLDQIAGVFAALVGQTPEIKGDPNQAMFYDRTLYQGHLVSPEDAALMTPEQIDQMERIPVYFIKQDGHWYVTSETFGRLDSNVNNTPLPKEILDALDDASP